MLEDYTEKQIREMDAGRELDELVVSIVYFFSNARHYSASNYAAMDALEDFCGHHGLRWAIRAADDDGDYKCTIKRRYGGNWKNIEWAPTLALAICRALVLTAKRWGKPKEQGDA